VVQIVSKPEPSWGLREIVILIYFIGLIIALFRLIYQSLYIHVISKMSRTITKGKHTIVLVEKDITPFAYFSKIFIPASKMEETSFESILEHEKSHLRQYHFLDLFLIEIVTIIQWFNPIVWLYERSMKEIHEFMADDEVLKQGVSRGNYQALLVNQALGGPVFTISHQFNQSLILKRIVMMTKMKSPQLAKIKVLLFIQLTAILIMAFSNPEPLVNPVVEKVQSLTQQITDSRLLPEDLTSQNTSIIEKGSITIKGTVTDGSTSKPIKGVNIIVQGTTTGTTSDQNGVFEIKADGSDIYLVLTHIGYTTLINEYKSSSNNAIIKMFTGAHDLSAVTVKTPGDNQEPGIKPFPYVLVDGVVVDEETFKALDPNKIESVNVLKDESATALYGEKGKNGVILVVTKKGNNNVEVKVSENKKSENNAVYTVVEEMPTFPGGESERARFISNNLRVPAENLEGTVYVSFIVNEDGSITDAKILRGLGKNYDEEVLRVINLMPKWLPGKQNGEASAVRFNMPVKFSKK
jgi:TonB family protein